MADIELIVKIPEEAYNSLSTLDDRFLSSAEMILKHATPFPKDYEKKMKTTKERIVRLAVVNNLVAEVYDMLHHIVIAELCSLQCKSDRLNSELRLVKKFANADKLDVIKDILEESEDMNDRQ